MAQLLDEMVDRIRALPAAEQESSVRFVLGELEEDQRWTASTLAHAEAIANAHETRPGR